MAKVITQEALDAAIAKAVAKNTKEVLKSVGQSVKDAVVAAGEIEDRAQKKAVVGALKDLGATIKAA